MDLTGLFLYPIANWSTSAAVMLPLLHVIAKITSTNGLTVHLLSCKTLKLLTFAAIMNLSLLSKIKQMGKNLAGEILATENDLCR